MDRRNAVATYIKEELKIDNPTAEQIAEETFEWTKRNPDWNKCFIVPVAVTSNTSAGTITGVSNDLSLSSARLVKGTQKDPIRIQVYYTRVAPGQVND